MHDLNVSNIVNAPRTSPRVVADRFQIELGYDADISGRALLAARLRQRGRLARLWAAHPGELTRAAEASAWRLRGTHERAQDDGTTLTDRVQHAARDWRVRWQRSVWSTRLALPTAACRSPAVFPFRLATP